MRQIVVRFRPALAVFALTLAVPAGAQKGLIPIVIETDAGKITAVLDSAHAPISVANFLKYVDAKHYDGGRFHRTVRMDNQPNHAVKIEVIQGGVAPAKARDGWAPIELERTNITGLHHGDGALSMARAAANTATSDFFVTINEQPELDFGGKRNADGQGFAVFGKVTAGMNVVRKIQAGQANGQSLTPPITIFRITRRR
jgi:peptidyl-prolyl cis-trans isomerase A (cyclophilin A)